VILWQKILAIQKKDREPREHNLIRTYKEKNVMDEYLLDNHK
jgi:hypothetical protein